MNYTEGSEGRNFNVFTARNSWERDMVLRGTEVQSMEGQLDWVAGQLVTTSKWEKSKRWWKASGETLELCEQNLSFDRFEGNNRAVLVTWRNMFCEAVWAVCRRPILRQIRSEPTLLWLRKRQGPIWKLNCRVGVQFSGLLNMYRIWPGHWGGCGRGGN